MTLGKVEPHQFNKNQIICELYLEATLFINERSLFKLNKDSAAEDADNFVLVAFDGCFVSFLIL